jgi:cytochrome oxidase assembly protein ShyY1
VAAGRSPQQIEAADGWVTITGRLFASVDGGRLGSPVNGVPQVSRLDLDTAQDAIGLEVVDRWVQAEDPDWRRGVIPIPVARPPLDEGPHLSYAFQWFFFSTSTVIAYALILRRRRADAAIPRNDQ